MEVAASGLSLYTTSDGLPVWRQMEPSRWKTAGTKRNPNGTLYWDLRSKWYISWILQLKIASVFYTGVLHLPAISLNQLRFFIQSLDILRKALERWRAAVSDLSDLFQRRALGFCSWSPPASSLRSRKYSTIVSNSSRSWCVTSLSCFIILQFVVVLSASICLAPFTS